MCIILFAFNYHPEFKLILAANRDEFYNRPTGYLALQPDNQTYCGKDLKEGGTWFGVRKNGNLSAVTNYRSTAKMKDDVISRGLIVADSLKADQNDLQGYISELSYKREQSNGYNLVFGNVDSLHYYSNTVNKHIKINPGIHGLSNAFFNTNWPKIKRGKNQLEEILSEDFDADMIFQLLMDRELADDKDLPDTGVKRDIEKILSPIFINSEEYGTRSSTVLLIGKDSKVYLEERSYNNKAEIINEVNFTFWI
jgi:uncharacterized protein with NRDE domain